MPEVTVNQDEVSKLFSEKGELVSQLEAAQYRLGMVNARLQQLGILPIFQNPQSK